MGATVFNLDYATNRSFADQRAAWFSLLNADRSPRAAYTKFQQARGNGYLPS